MRIVIEPRSRTVDPDVLMESLFRLTDLEVRVPLNLNVLDKSRTPRVMSLRLTSRQQGRGRPRSHATHCSPTSPCSCGRPETE